jgi:hypothetical protein
MGPILAIEQRRLAEQVRLDQQKSPAERNRWGQFATPPSLSLDIAGFARELWERRRDRVRFLDPAIGTGSFYAALRACFLDDQIEAAVGIELDRAFAEVTRGLWSQIGLDVRAEDFTKQRPPGSGEQFNLILTNPPYVRHHHLDTEEKERLKARVFRSLGIEISGLAGHYCYFLLLAHEWLADDGIAAWLIPSEFMTVNYGSAIRRYLAEHVTLLRVHRFCPSDVQFADALVSSVIVVFEKRRPVAGQSAEFSFGGRLLDPQTVQQVAIDDLRRSDRWTDFPCDHPQPTEGDKHCTLGDLFTIKRGLATGANDFFIIPRREARELEIPPRFLRPILPSPRFLDETVIESDSEGYPRLPAPLALIDCGLAESELKRAFPKFWNYLKTGKQRGIDQLYLPSRRSPWYSQEQRDPAPFLCTCMGRTGYGGRSPFRFIWNQSQATAANVYLLLYPRGSLKTVLHGNPRMDAEVFAALQQTTSAMFLGESRVYGGGLYKLEPRELGRVSAETILAAVPALKAGRPRRLFA